MVCTLIAFNWNWMVTLISLKKKKRKWLIQAEHSLLVYNKCRAGQGTTCIHSEHKCFLCQEIKTYKQKIISVVNKPCKNEALLVEFKGKVLVAVSERGWGDQQRVHSNTIWIGWRTDIQRKIFNYTLNNYKLHMHYLGIQEKWWREML